MADEILIKYLLKSNPTHPLCLEFNNIIEDFQTRYDKLSTPVKNNHELEHFLKAISYGNIILCKYLHLENNYNLHIDNEIIFRWACECGKLNIAQWLLQISNNQININDAFCAAFRLAVQNNHTHVIDWLLRISIPSQEAINCAKMMCRIKKNKNMFMYLELLNISKINL